MVTRTVAWILGRCGDAVSLVDGAVVQSTRAVVQPIQQTTTEMRLPTAVGQMDEGRYLYLGPPQFPLEARRHTVVWKGATYAVQSAHPIYVGGDISHWWAVLVGKKEGIG